MDNETIANIICNCVLIISVVVMVCVIANCSLRK